MISLTHWIKRSGIKNILIAAAIAILLIFLFQQSYFIAILVGVLFVSGQFAIDQIIHLQKQIEHKNIEIKELTAPKQLLQMDEVINRIDIAFVMVDEKDNLVHLNDLAIRTFKPALRGQKVDGFKDLHISSLIRVPKILDAIEKLRYEHLNELNLSDVKLGEEQQYSLRVLRLNNHTQKGFLCLSFSDLTKAKKIEKTRADFVANASHELRTPLASISGFIETLQNGAINNPKMSKKFLEIMAEQSERMARLIDDLLTLSKIEMSSHHLPEQRVDLCQIGEQVKNAFMPIAKREAIKLSLSKQVDDAFILGDQDQLIQLVTNLVDNAFKYGIKEDQSENHIEIGVGIDDKSKCFISIKDNGVGIDKKHLPRLTERFYRISDDHKAKGTGLGLAIVKHIISRHKARISFNSEINVGTEIVISFNKA